MIACRFLAVTDNVVSKLSTRETVALETPTAAAISLSVTIMLRPLKRGEKELPASDDKWQMPIELTKTRGRGN
jgi:hypothetical protein